MGEDLTQLRRNLKMIAEGIENLEELWSRLQNYEGVKSLQVGPEAMPEIQEIALKMTAVRELVDKIDIKLDEVEERIGNIESLNFRSRSDF